MHVLLPRMDHRHRHKVASVYVQAGGLGDEEEISTAINDENQV